jgi:hypothetical protein
MYSSIEQDLNLRASVSKTDEISLTPLPIVKIKKASQINEKPFSNIDFQYIVNAPQIEFAVVGVEYGVICFS